MKTAKPLDCKSGSSGIARPLFSPGLLLEDEDLTAGVDYTRELSQLLFRSLFGCGVICGLEIKGELFCKRQRLRVTVGPGLALDGAGHPMHVTKSVPLATPHDCEKLPEWVWVVICYRTLDCHSREIACSPDADSQTVKTRAVDAYEIKLYGEQPVCACACGLLPKKPDDKRQLGNCCEELLEEEEDDAAASAAAGAATSTTTDAPTEPDPCDCYRKHFHAASCSDCECSCVLLAKVSTTLDAKKKEKIDPSLEEEIETLVDVSVRRWIRPVLTGMCKCRKSKTSAGTGATASASYAAAGASAPAGTAGAAPAAGGASGATVGP